MAAFNPLAMLAERTCAPIYNAIDTGNSVLAIKHADKVLASQPNLSLASALKTIALIRTGKKAEASKLCDLLLKRDLTKNGDDVALHPLTWSLSRLGRGQDEVALLEKATKAQPANEDLARQAFLAMVKHKYYQKAQQTSFKMHKSFDGSLKDPKARWQYFWWSIQSYILLSRRAEEPGAALALPLCERMIASHSKVQLLDENAEEELALQLAVLTKQGKKAEAFALLSAVGTPADKLCERSLSLEFFRRELAEEFGEWPFVRDEAKAKLEAGSRNWAHVLAFVKASARIGSDSVEQAGKLVEALASDEAGSKDRSARLARLELLRANAHGTATAATETSERASTLIVDYFQTFGTKPCCHEDVLSYLSLLSSEHRVQLSGELERLRRAHPVKDEKDLRWNINIAKVQRSVVAKDEITVDSELKTAAVRLEEYLQGLTIGKELPDTEMQPADDLALLAAQSLISAYAIALQQRISILHQAVTLLEYACARSKKGYQLRMLLIRCYLILGCYDRASIHYSLIGIKVIQNDTLSHLWSDRVSAFGAAASPPSSGGKVSESVFRLLVNKAILAAEEIYDENLRSTPEMVVKCFEHGTFSRVEEFVEFGEAIDRSIQRQLFRIESARSKTITLSSSNVSESDRQRLVKEIATLALSVKQDLARGCHDQRDFAILPNFQPLDTPGIIEQTALGPIAKTGWLKAMNGLFDSTAVVKASSDDNGELTAAEREMYDLITKRSAGTLEAAAIEKFFSGRRTLVSTLTATLRSGETRPFDLLHTVSNTLETYSHLFSSVHTSSDLEETKATAQAHLREMAMLISDASKRLTSNDSSSSSTDLDVLERGLAALGKKKIESLRRATSKNTAKSLEKVLDALENASSDV